MKPIGSEVGLTLGCDHADFAPDVGDAIVTASRRTYLIIAARRTRSRRQASVWALRCIIAEWPPPPGVRVYTMTWWSRSRSPRT